MTPKEKAKELIDKYIDLSGIYVGGYQNEKQMCLIAVDEILDFMFLSESENSFWINYYNKVKKEIENYDNPAS